jgi:glutathione S-transferase
MSEPIVIHSFGMYDRSGKVRWMAHELGLSVENVKVGLGEHRKFPYRDLNPYAAIPAVKWQGRTLFESSAICTFIAEQFPQAGLIVAADEPGRADYLQWMAVCADTLETKLVEYYLAGSGLMPPETRDLYDRALRFKLRITLEQMPESGFLVADRLTLADISLAYCLRLALSSELIELDAMKHYLKPLAGRSAAIEAEFFSNMTFD